MPLNNDNFFAYLRRKKQEWSGKPKARLTQAEVDEANGVLDPEMEPIVITAPRTPSEGLASKVKPLTAIVGSIAAASLLTTVPKEEGTRYQAYRDVAGIITICQGDTKNVQMGMIETPEGCRQRLESQLAAHAQGVLACSPSLNLPGKDYQRAAAVSLAYNIGVGAYCKSSVDKYFDKEEWANACNSFMAWNKARVNGQLVPVAGLTARRERERNICLKGVA